MIDKPKEISRRSMHRPIDFDDARQFCERIERRNLESLLEELAEIIEDEGGLLIP